MPVEQLLAGHKVDPEHREQVTIFFSDIVKFTEIAQKLQPQKVPVCCSVLQRVAACCSGLQCVAVCCSVLQRVAVCCSVAQCVAVCCSVLQCVAASEM